MEQFRKELTDNILAYWIDKMQDCENGGFYGRIDGNENLQPKANKGAILNARILWTFSSAYRILKKPEYLEMANRAYQYMLSYFLDKEYGGIYWELDYTGKPVNTKKQIYAQGFALYGFSEYYRITQKKEVLNHAKEIFYLIEKYKDSKNGGYFEAYTQNWQPIEDMRLSAKDANEKKSQNTHLHILEPYTNLLRVWRDPQLIEAQKELIDIFSEKILDSDTYHLNLFFDERWNVKSTAISYGHDIEASWLLVEAAEVLGDKGLIDTINKLSIKIADAATKGLLPDGSMMYESDGQHYDKSKHWWVQAEAIVGYMYAYKNTNRKEYLEKASNLWKYIKEELIDKENNEWFWSIKADGSINRDDDKAGFWKCPYHNGRMCMEIIEHFYTKDFIYD